MIMRHLEKLSWKYFISFFLIANLIYGIMIFITMPKLQAGVNGLPVFDMRPMGYTYEEANELLGLMDIKTKEFYQNIQLPLDIIYPFFLALYSALFYIKISKIKFIKSIGIFISCLVCIFDYCENIGIFIMLNGMISRRNVVAFSMFSELKTILTMVMFTGIIMLLFFEGYSYLKRGMSA